METILNDRINTYEMEDDGSEYEDPMSGIERECLRPRMADIKRKVGFRLPCRLASPIIEMPNSIPEYFRAGGPRSWVGLESFTLSALYALNRKIEECQTEIFTNSGKFYADMEVMLGMVAAINQDLEGSYRGKVTMQRMAISRLAIEATKLDLNQAAMRSDLKFDESIQFPTMDPFLHLIMKLRAILTRNLEKANRVGYTYKSTEPDCTVEMHSDGYIEMKGARVGRTWRIILADRFVAIYHEQYSGWNIVGMSYLDYVVTRSEILLNMEVIGKTREYSDLVPLFEFFRDFVNCTFAHEHCVGFMKKYEGFLNMTADFKSDPRCSVGSYLDTINGLIDDDFQITRVKTTVSDVIHVLFSDEINEDMMDKIKWKTSYLLYLCYCIRDLTPVRLLEASSLHKFCFYSVIDEVRGVKKFLSRTHTQRNIETQAIKQMRALFNREYICGYMQRHKRLPTILSDEALLNECDIVFRDGKQSTLAIKDKVGRLNAEIRKTGRINQASKPLMWWYDMRPYDSEDSKLIGDPIEQAKDKRSAKDEGTYSNMDSEKELEAIMKSEEFNYLDVLSEISDDVVPKSVEIIQQGSRNYNEQLTAILKEKEREQKVEGRLFGMFTTRGKQKISMMMRKAEHVLNYFDGNLMTIPDKKRKMKLHWMAQSLLDDDKYAVLADIEGHNQSMQFENTGDLLESVGLCFGETGWHKLSMLFSNLNLFYARVYVDEAYLSKGQLGGIEGWYNPIWTLHTLIISKLLPETTQIVTTAEAVYSDDIALVVSSMLSDNESQNRLLRTIQQHFGRFGMILKPIQTVVSKFRITMLRQHYIAGIRADSSLKRMVSVSGMGSPSFHSDELEASGISSAISSSLELSNTVFPQTLLKWFRVSHLLFRSFTSALCTKVEPGIMNEDYFMGGTVSIFRTYFDYGGNPGDSWLLKRLDQLFDGTETEAFIEHLKKAADAKVKKSLASSELESMTDHIVRLVKEDKMFVVLFIMRCMLPLDLGGSGVLALEQMILTGVRDNTGRLMGIIRSMFKHDDKTSRLADRILENALGGTGKRTKNIEGLDDQLEEDVEFPKDRDGTRYTIEFPEENLVGQEWPNAQRVATPSDLIRSKLLHHFQQVCRNKSLLLLLEKEKLRPAYKQKVVDYLRSGFTEKMAHFYLDVSAFSIMDKILKKVENTSSMIKSVRGFPRLCHQLSNLGLIGSRKWLSRPIFIFGVLSNSVSIQEYLFQRRVIMYPMVEFLPVIEPEVNSLIEPIDQELEQDSKNDWSHHLVMASGNIHKDGKSRYLPPLYGNEAMYKGDLRDSTDGFSHLREALMIKCVSVTKWILYRSDPNKYLERIKKSTNISNLADHALATLGYRRFSMYEEYVSLLARSEIMHRIPVMDEKPQAVCRSLPNETPKFKVITNQVWINYNELGDSDIHFDYFKMRLISAESVSLNLGSLPVFSKLYRTKLNYLVSDVQYDYVAIDQLADINDFFFEDALSGANLVKTKIRWLTSNLTQITSGEYSPIAPKVIHNDDVEVETTDLIEVLIMDYYRSLKTQNLWDLNPIWGHSMWLPFIKRYGSMIPGEPEEKLIKIRDVIRTEVYQRLTFVAKQAAISIDSVTVDRVIDLIRDSEISSDDRTNNQIEQVHNVLESVNRRPGDMKEKTNNATKILESMRLLRKRVIIGCFQEVVLRNCLSISMRGGRAIVNLEQSRYLVDLLLHDLSVLVNVEDREALLMSVISENLREEYLIEAADSLLINAMTMVEDGLSHVEESEMILAKVSIDPGELNLGAYPIDDYELQCHITPFDTSDYSNTDRFLKLNQFRHSLIRQFSNPDYSEGPYGSDVYQTAKSCFSELKIYGVIGDDDVVLDLASGRGECAYALEELGIMCESYSRKDVYGLVRHHYGITYIDDYDLCSIKLPDLIPVRVRAIGKDNAILLFDLSHFGSKAGVFRDRLLDVLELAERVIVRFAAISSLFKEIMGYCESKGLKVFLLTVSTGTIVSPTSYVLIASGHQYTGRLPPLTDSHLTLARYVQDCVTLVKYGPQNTLEDGPKYNSVLEDLGGYETACKDLEDKLENIAGMSQDKHVMYLMSNLNIVNYCPIYRRLYESLKDLGCRDEVEVFARKITWDEFFESKGIIRTKEDYGKFKDKDTEEFINWVDLSRVRPEILRTLRRYHHTNRWRRICQSLLITGVLGDKLAAELNEDYILRTWGNQFPRTLRGNIRTRNLNDALALLSADVISRNSTLHRSLISRAVRGGVMTLKRGKDLMYYRKMLSCLHNPMKRLLSMIGVSERLGEILSNYVLDSFVKHGAQKKTKLYSASIETRGNASTIDVDSQVDANYVDQFMEGLDRAMNLDLLGDRLVSSQGLRVIDDRDTSFEANVFDQDYGVSSGFFSAENLGWEVSDDIVEAESAQADELMSSIIGVDGETEEERRKRAETIAMYASMMSDY